MIKRTIIATLRYYNIYRPNYNLSSELNFNSKKDNDFIKEKIKKSKLFFEYGSGNTTLFANKHNIPVISVESDKSFYKVLKKKIQSRYVLYDFGIVDYYSRPLHRIFKINSNISMNYCYHIFKDRKNYKILPDLILIDGRYRVLCAIAVHEFLKFYDDSELPTIILDDYLNRKNYSILENFYNVKLINRIAILSPILKKMNFDELKYKYINDAN